MENHQTKDDSAAVAADEPELPGPEHERLKLLVGSWDSTVKVWSEGAQDDPMVLTGRTTRSWALDSYFIEEWHTEYGDDDEIEFEAASFIGYNQQSGLFESVRMATDSTGMRMETGRYSSASNAIMMQGSYVDSDTGHVVQARTELKVLDPDNHVRTVYLTREDGREYKYLEINYTRYNEE